MIGAISMMHHVTRHDPSGEFVRLITIVDSGRTAQIGIDKRGQVWQGSHLIGRTRQSEGKMLLEFDIDELIWSACGSEAANHSTN